MLRNSDESGKEILYIMVIFNKDERYIFCKTKYTYKKSAPNWERTFYVFNFNVCDGHHDAVRDEGRGMVLGQAHHDDGDDHNARANPTHQLPREA